MSNKRCPCRDWTGCNGFEWYSYSDICFCRMQTIWLIGCLDTLEQGIYPPDPTPTGYIDIPLTQPTGINPHAHFETPAQLAAETNFRLNRCHDDGRTLKHEVYIFHSEFGLSFINLAYLSEAATNALNYCSGWRRKQIGYSRWKAASDYRRRQVSLVSPAFASYTLEFKGVSTSLHQLAVS